MGVLEKVMDLKNKGVSDSEIISILREKGASPKSISDALSQAKIKGAVSSQGTRDEEMEPSLMGPENSEDLPTEGSISDEDLTPLPSGLPPSMLPRNYVPLHQEADEEEDYVPQPMGQQEVYSPPQYAPPQYVPQAPQQQYSDYQQQPQEEYAPQQYAPQEYVPQEGYEYQQPVAGGGVSDTDTIIEISEQVFADKMKGVLKQIESFNEFKTLSEIKVENISDRLKRIEASIDKLQIAILEKIGSYGRGIDTLKKEMEMVQNSFGKIVNLAAENSGTGKHTHHNQSHQQTEHHPSHTIHRTEKKTTVVHKSAHQGKKHSKK